MKTWANRLSNLFLLCLCSLSQLAIIRDSFDCQTAPESWIWLLLLCVLLWYSSSFKRGILLGMPLAAALLFFVYRHYGGSPVLELQDLIDHISGAFYSHITHPNEVYPYSNATGSHTLVLLLLGFFLAACQTTALHSRYTRISLSLLETLPVFLACVVVNGDMPTLPTLGMLLFWFLLLAGGKGYKANGNGWRTLLCCLLPVSLLLGLLLQFHRPEDYRYTDYDRELNQRYEQYFEYFDLFASHSSQSESSGDSEKTQETASPRASFQNAWTTEENSMDLSAPFDEDQTHQRLMQVRAETTGRLYLRTRSYGDYAGSCWVPAEELSSGSSLPFAAFAAEGSAYGIKREVEIRTDMDLNSLCIPYYAAVSSGSDSMVTGEERIRYRIGYIDYRGSISDLQISQVAASAELLYRAHAHSFYTNLPESTREAALEICREAGLRADDPEILQAVASYVQQSAEYDLTVTAFPSQDYAIYFLTQAHRGYCIHFASAAAVLYRALGIPARVTEGFVAQTRAGSFRDVQAGDAHAWVEVYLDGVGWIPVEVTSQAGIATMELSASPTPTQVDPLDASAEPSTDPEGQPTYVPEGEEEEIGGNEDTDSSKQGKPLPWGLFLILPGMALALALWYGIARALFHYQVQDPDGRRAVLACWRYANRAAAFGAEIPAPLVESAEKVAFSLHTIQRDELDLCRRELFSLIETLYPALKPFSKFRFRFLRGLK